MTTRKIRENLGPGGEATASRGGMMMVAGEEDLDVDDLLVDDEKSIDEEDNTTMKGPVYPEGKTIRIRLGDLRRLLAKKV